MLVTGLVLAAACKGEGGGSTGVDAGLGPDENPGVSPARDAGPREAVVRDAEYERPAPVSEVSGHPWMWKDIGGAGGSMRFANSTLTVRAGGSGLSSAADGLGLVAVKLRGDGEVIARVRSLQMAAPASTAGVILRADDSTPGAPSVYLGVVADPSKGGLAIVRRGPGAAAEPSPGDVQIRAGQFLRIRREGRRFSLARSTDRLGWVKLGSYELDLPAELSAGVAVSAARPAGAVDGGAGGLTTAEFDQLRVLGFDAPMAARGFELEPFAGNGAVASIAGGEVAISAGGDVFTTTSEGGVALFAPGVGAETITARVDAVGGPAAGKARVGLTFREGGPARVGPGFRHALISIDAAGRLAFQKRDRVTNFDPGQAVMGAKLPIWLRLVRYDDASAWRTRIQGLYSQDGATFVPLDTVEMPLADPMLVGVHFTAGDTRIHGAAKLGGFAVTPTATPIAAPSGDGGVPDAGADAARPDAGGGS